MLITGLLTPLLIAVGAAQSAEIKVLAADGIKAVVEELAPKFERATGNKLSITFASGGATVKRAEGSEVADVIIAPLLGIDGLVKNGKVAAANVTALAVTGISVAVRRRGEAGYLVARGVETHLAS